MFETHEIQQGRETITVLELTLFAFTTPKGTFTLSGSNTDGTDTWKNIDTGEFHEWSRESIKSWLEQGKILPVAEATTLVWYQNQRRPSKERPQSKVIQK